MAAEVSFLDGVFGCDGLDIEFYGMVNPATLKGHD